MRLALPPEQYVYLDYLFVLFASCELWLIVQDCKSRRCYRGGKPHTSVLCKCFSCCFWFPQQIHRQLSSYNWWSLLLFCKDDIRAPKTQSSFSCFCRDCLHSFAWWNHFCTLGNLCDCGEYFFNSFVLLPKTTVLSVAYAAFLLVGRPWMDLNGWKC